MLLLIIAESAITAINGIATNQMPILRGQCPIGIRIVIMRRLTYRPLKLPRKAKVVGREKVDVGTSLVL